MTLHHKNKSYTPIMELTSQSMENIKTLQEKKKKKKKRRKKKETLAPLMELTTKSMKNQRKKTIIPFNQHM